MESRSERATYIYIKKISLKIKEIFPQFFFKSNKIKDNQLKPKNKDDIQTYIFKKIKEKTNNILIVLPIKEISC